MKQIKEHENLSKLFATGPVMVNIGLDSFAASVKEQQVPVVSLDWRPPAGGDLEMADLVSKLM